MHFTRSLPVAAALAAALAAPSIASAYTHRHDGFFLRLALGPGYLSTSRTSSTTRSTQSISGGAIALDIAVGGMVTPNFALHADLYGSQALNPTVRSGSSSAIIDNSSLTAAGLGIGATYYVMPVNLYLSASIGVGSLTVRFRSLGVEFTGDSDPGVSLNFMLGKEFWVSPDWGIGVAGQVFYMAIPSNSSSSTRDNFDTFGLNLLFSATYN